MHKGNCLIAGRKSPHSLYNFQLATYDRGDLFDQGDSAGFIRIWALPLKIQARAQLIKPKPLPLSLRGTRRRRSNLPEK
jgi:argininosuccinate synthase